jgi:hypothetical protein
MKELYFHTRLTENEHCIVHGMIQNKCNELDIELVYYRKLKLGHTPMYRECKVRGTSLGYFKKYLREEKLVTKELYDEDYRAKHAITFIEWMKRLKEGTWSGQQSPLLKKE